MGHAFMILLVLLVQTLVYREVTALFALGAPKTSKSKSDSTTPVDNPESAGKDPWSKTVNWYFFAVTNYFLYGESLIYYFKARLHFHVCFSFHTLSCPYYLVLHSIARCLRRRELPPIRNEVTSRSSRAPTFSRCHSGCLSSWLDVELTGNFSPSIRSTSFEA